MTVKRHGDSLLNMVQPDLVIAQSAQKGKVSREDVNEEVSEEQYSSKQANSKP
eukprot:CAMPEP_0170466854 /NCGR_PEP_ID=MMETSP0123-20130129/10652_1 /TAXON_ID=182087 /ORGANISM="Favella ehrenbergii, Strain Fehren 1" /LENGTH=52 /DNA_ID=CAMNT_0010733075 /DNA_START=386 /DNA_END=544 /DNA_ORIENTATION=+